MKSADTYEVEDDIDFKEIARRRRDDDRRPVTEKMTHDPHEFEMQIREIRHLRHMGWRDEEIRERLAIGEGAYRNRLEAGGIPRYRDEVDTRMVNTLEVLIASGKPFPSDAVPFGSVLGAHMALLKTARAEKRIQKVGTAKTLEGKLQTVWQATNSPNIASNREK